MDIRNLACRDDTGLSMVPLVTYVRFVVRISFQKNIYKYFSLQLCTILESEIF